MAQEGPTPNNPLGVYVGAGLGLSGPGEFCYKGAIGEQYFSGGDSNWDFAYGVGTQVSFGPVAWRLEYVRVNATGNESGGDPDMLSAGVSWRFF